MRDRSWKGKNLVTILLAATPLFCVGLSANAQTSSTQNRAVRNDETTRQELAQFDKFLDSHPEIAEQLRRNPSLADNSKFVKSHPALQTYLQEQPGVREQLKEDPDAFMRQEDAFARRDDFANGDWDRRQVAEFNQFLDSHREIAEQVRRDPSLVNREQFLKDHPELQTYLEQHPDLRTQISQNPDGFMRQEDNYEHGDDSFNRNGESDRKDDAYNRSDADRRGDDQASRFSQFLADHPEIAEQLRRDPTLANREDFLKTHPALQAYVRQHPDIGDEMKRDPDGFMRQENALNRDSGRDLNRDQMASFRQFLGDHATISDQLSRDPLLVKNHDYVQNHPELEAYLSAHPDVRDRLMTNPENYVGAEGQFGDGGKTTNSAGAPATGTSTSGSGSGSGDWSGKSSNSTSPAAPSTTTPPHNSSR